MIRSWKVFAEGHTDSVGTPDYNLGLSERRARAVMNWLQGKGKLTGVPVEVIGFGLTTPIAENTTPAGRALNRRVEIRIYG